jgi:putative heme-binding domain-containing protein
VLLTAMEQKQVAANSLDAPRRQRLLEHNDESIRSRAQTLFQTAGRSNRLEVLARYADAARQDGDAALGQVLFRKHCAACHKLGDVGFAVGPDLAALVNKSPEYLLVAILDPHRVVEERYQSYAAQTVDGRIITGMLANETSASVTLVEQEGKTHVLLRRDIELLQATGKSLMPEGLENDVAPQQLADLITLLMKLGPESASGK